MGIFDPGRLMQELLSLGHPRITMEVAQALTQEVASILGASPKREITASWVSQVVEERLKNRGILGRPPEKLAEAAEDETLTFEERGESRTRGLLQKVQGTSLPTLEKFLSAPPPAPATAVPVSATPLAPLPEPEKINPLPPRARIRIHAPMKSGPEGTAPESAPNWEEKFSGLAERAASVESHWPSSIDSKTLAVEFFNTMANQEFYPHAPELWTTGGEDRQAFGAGQVWMDLPLGPESVESVIRNAQKVWREGAAVSFILKGDGSDVGFQQESFEKFLQAVEKALLELPENVAVPPRVGLHLEMDSPEASSWARLALSGKYYPKFCVSLALSPNVGAITSSHEDFELLRTQGSLLLRHDLHDGREAKTFPRWSGGPELEPYEFCQLGSLNLSILACGGDVDWVKLRRIVRTAVHFLDNLIESQSYPVEAIAERSRANRKIGLGVMGLAELFHKLSIPYQSEPAAILAEKTMRFIQHEALEASHQLAKTRGVFPNYSLSRWKAAGRKVRHRTLTAVCPAPALAALAGVTPGINPLQSERKEIPATYWARMQSALERPSDGAAGVCFELTEDSPSLSAFLEQTFHWGLRQVELAQDLRPALISRPQIPEIPVEVEMVSETTPEPPVQESELATEEVTEVTDSLTPVVPRPTPEVMEARSHRIQTSHGEMKVVLGFDRHGPFELLARVGKAGSEASAQAEALSRLISLLFSVGVEPQRIWKELMDIQWVPSLTTRGTSIPDGLAQIISVEFPEKNTVEDEILENEGQEEITEILEAGTIH